MPVKAVVRYDGKDHVAVKRPGGRVEWRDVVLGASDGSIVEVKEGLRGGEQVILEAEPLLSDEQRARRDAVIDPFREKAAIPKKGRIDPIGEKAAIPKKGRSGGRPRPLVIVADRDGVIRVPVAAVACYDGKDHMAVIRPPGAEKPGGGIEWREVVLGASDG